MAEKGLRFKKYKEINIKFQENKLLIFFPLAAGPRCYYRPVRGRRPGSKGHAVRTAGQMTSSGKRSSNSLAGATLNMLKSDFRKLINPAVKSLKRPLATPQRPMKVLLKNDFRAAEKNSQPGFCIN